MMAEPVLHSMGENGDDVQDTGCGVQGTPRGGGGVCTAGLVQVANGTCARMSHVSGS
jgi:hypothetical protein